MNEVATADEDLAGIATTYTGTNKENIYGLSGNLYKKLFNTSNNTLENINLGIKEIPNPDYTIVEDLDSIRIEMKGYSYTYYSGNRGRFDLEAVPTVRIQGKTNLRGYTHPIYPADVAYDVKNSTEELKVYAKYGIRITNPEKTDIEELYQENK